jgi:hypothetical protein
MKTRIKKCEQQILGTPLVGKLSQVVGLIGINPTTNFFSKKQSIE